MKAQRILTIAAGLLTAAAAEANADTFLGTLSICDPNAPTSTSTPAAGISIEAYFFRRDADVAMPPVAEHTDANVTTDSGGSFEINSAWSPDCPATGLADFVLISAEGTSESWLYRWDCTNPPPGATGLWVAEISGGEEDGDCGYGTFGDEFRVWFEEDHGYQGNRRLRKLPPARNN